MCPRRGPTGQVAGEALYTYDEKMDRDGLYGALAITTVAAGAITAIDTTAAAGGCFLPLADVQAGVRQGEREKGEGGGRGRGREGVGRMWR
jgi:hypothetical protein